MKNIKSVYKYAMSTFLKSYAYFYAVMTALIIVLFLLGKATGSDGGFSGIEFVTVVFIISGIINAYKVNLNFFTQCGISRKTVFAGMGAVLLTVAVLCGITDTLLAILGNFIEAQSNNQFVYESFYEQLFLTNSTCPAATDFIKLPLFLAGFDIIFAAVGFFIAAMFYRLNKALKLIVPVSIVMIIISLSYIDTLCFKGVIYQKIISAIGWIFSYWLHVPLMFAAAAVIIFAISYLFVRRCPVSAK